MSATEIETAFTLIAAENTPAHGSAHDFLVTDEGVLYGTTDGGDHWRCLGMVDAVAFLFDIGCPEGCDELLEAPRARWKRRASRLPA